MAIVIDQYSVAAKPIEERFGDQPLAAATAFGWRAGSQDFLFTNWHVVTGIDPDTEKHLSRTTAAEPDTLVVHLDRREKLGVRVAVSLKLRDAEGAPLWLEHPQFGRKVDVVALPILLPDELDLHPINEMQSVRMSQGIGMDCFILGYPFRIGPALLPIWKRASIASEPQISVAGRPHFYVDTASRSGMSGAPVIRRQWGSYEAPNGDQHFGQDPEGYSEFIGVYSGRVGAKDEFEAQLGIVWRAEVAEQIIEGARRGSRP